MGLLLFAASPKSGKTRMLLQVGASVSRGEDVFGRYPVRQGTVLYYALEDGESRFGEHARDLGAQDCENLIVFDAVPHTGSNDYKWLRDDLRQYGDVRLVIVDVLNRVLPKVDSGKGAYHDEAQALMPLQQLANEEGIAVVVVHHTRKSQEGSSPLLSINGTQALAGTADNIWILDRGSQSETGTLMVTGRDVKEQEVRLSFSKDAGRWSVKGGDAGVVLTLPNDDTKSRINHALQQRIGHEPVLRKELVAWVTQRVTGVGRVYLDTLVTKCLKEGVATSTLIETRQGTSRAYSLRETA